MSATSGKLLHLMLGNVHLLEDSVDVFQKDAARFGEDNITSLMFKKHQSEFLFQKRHGPAEAWLGDLESFGSLPEMLQGCAFGNIQAD